MRPSTIFLAAQALRAQYTAIATSSQSCTDYDINVSVERTTRETFQDRAYSADILYALARKEILVSNEYTLSSRLCTPVEKAQEDHTDTIQLLVHGASFNKVMWDLPYQPERYSWVKRMSEEGYPTLAVDLIGNGNSTFPDGLLEAQTQTYVENIHEVIQKLRRGEVDGKKWKKIVFVGFSIGGIVANSLAQQYPDDVDAIVLHGISWDASWIYPAFLSGLQAPAQQIDPDKWGHVPATYQTQSTREGRITACFSGAYDPNILEVDWNTRDFDSFGAAMTFTYHLVDAPEYKGPVFLGIGERDSTFCGGEVCGSQPYALFDKFPKASTHDIKVYPETGHLILYHYSGQDLMTDTLSFLKNVGF
ncbi:Alpha beta hydrolase fold protein [Lasiodiplodia theobromae]|uniref:Alpha beta hydrolase fold protein n=1 Tax=Lasiodiplodia theobromae TaxID=45133 RepID=UPI0015C3EA25|nr:Alpha beta hydrolase fold protein [Lasiodiplodia theobromae]KAF4543310.1 Alpha beta hydrolase fold protein [Lasiodiplodia theobromae]